MGFLTPDCFYHNIPMEPLVGHAAIRPFMEPMVTTAFLETQPTDTAAVPMASKHEPLGFYPDRYIVSWDGTAKEWRVALGGLTAVGQ